MTQQLSLPILTTVKIAYGDVFGKPITFFKVIWLVLLMMVLFIDLPMLITQREAYFSMHPDKRVEVAQSASTTKIDLPATEKQTPDTKLTDKTATDVMMKEASGLKLEYVLVMIGISLLQLLLLFSYSVAWYRQLLFGDNKDKTIIFHFGKMEYNFAITAMKSGLVMAPIVLLMMSYYIASIPGFSEEEPISLAEHWWLFVGCGLLLTYLVARVSMSYPLTMMGQFDEPIKQSWKITKDQPLPIAMGFFCMVIPASIAMIILVVAASYLMNMGGHIPEEHVSRTLDVTFAEHLIYRAIGSAYMLYVFALVSAFYARAYAFLVRSQQASPAV